MASSLSNSFMSVCYALAAVEIKGLAGEKRNVLAEDSRNQPRDLRRGAAPLPRLAPVTAMVRAFATSMILEPGLAFLEEGRHAFLRIPGLVRERREAGLDPEAFVERRVERARHGVAGQPENGQAIA